MKTTRIVLQALAASTLTACGLWLSFDGYDTDHVGFYTVSGTVDGLAKDTRVELALNAQEKPLEIGNGPFSFEDRLTTGQRFEVTATPPAGQACAVDGGAGNVGTSNVTGVTIHCASSDAELSALTVSAGELAPPFDPATLAYELRLGILGGTPPSVNVSATPHGPTATMRLGEAPLLPGTPSPVAVPIALGAKLFDLEVTSTTDLRAGPPAVKHYTATRGIAPIEYLKASNTRGATYFGYAVAISGDTLVVGASNESSGAKGIGGDQTDASALDAGAVYVFVRTPKGWSQQAYVKASDAQSGARFGSAVAIEGDVMVVGAPGLNPLAGSAYVFRRSGTIWSEEAHLTSPVTSPSDLFGSAIALSGDTVAVGAFGEANAAGAVHVFTRGSTGWTRQQSVKASNTQAQMRFGTSVAVEGDTLAVGAPDEPSSATGIGGNQSDTSAVSAGAVYVFTRTSGVWTQRAYVKASNASANYTFGTSVALSGDTLAVGSSHEKSIATGVDGDPTPSPKVGNAGAVYVFTRAGSAWSQSAYVKASNTPSSGQTARFGASVALSGDTLAVGAPDESSNAKGVNGNQDAGIAAERAGAVYYFVRSSGRWAQSAYIKASNTRTAGAFGASVALGNGILAVGATGDSSSAVGVNGDPTDTSLPLAGAAFIYR